MYHGDECHDPNATTICPDKCEQSINPKYFHCDMKWPRLNNYTTNGNETRHPCRAAKGKKF